MKIEQNFIKMSKSETNITYQAKRNHFNEKTFKCNNKAKCGTRRKYQRRNSVVASILFASLNKLKEDPNFIKELNAVEETSCNSKQGKSFDTPSNEMQRTCARIPNSNPWR